MGGKRLAMVKQRMSAADVCAEAACLRARYIGMRLANVYDINSKVTMTAFASKRCPSTPALSPPCEDTRKSPLCL